MNLSWRYRLTYDS